MASQNKEITQLVHAEINQALNDVSSRKEKSKLAWASLRKRGVHSPSAAMIRSITDHGSLNDIQRDINDFQADEISRQDRISQIPGIPEELQSIYADGLVKMLEYCMGVARAEFDADRKQLRLEVDQAMQQAAEAERIRGLIEMKIEGIEVELFVEREERQMIDSKLATVVADLNNSNAALLRAREQITASEQARLASEERYIKDLNVEREARKRDTEMLDGEIRFAKMQILESREHAGLLKDQLRQLQADKVIEIETWRQRASAMESRNGKLQLENQDLQARVVRLESMQQRVRPRIKASSPKSIQRSQNR